MRRPLSELADDVRRLRERSDLPREAREDVRDRLASVSDEWGRIDRPHAFRQFLSAYLRDERKRLRTGARDEPLCECGDPRCKLKQATVPPQVRAADDRLEAILDYQDDHPEAVVLLEAVDEWTATKARVRTALEDAYAMLDEAAHREGEYAEA